MENVGHQLAHAVLVFENNQEVVLPIRRRFEVTSPMGAAFSAAQPVAPGAHGEPVRSTLIVDVFAKNYPEPVAYAEPVPGSFNGLLTARSNLLHRRPAE